MRREIAPGIEIDDDPERVDIAEVHRVLSEESYWARGRSRARIEQAVRASARVVALYEGERQVGFARVLSDGNIAYLADVYGSHPDGAPGPRSYPAFAGSFVKIIFPDGLCRTLVTSTVTSRPTAVRPPSTTIIVPSGR